MFHQNPSSRAATAEIKGLRRNLRNQEARGSPGIGRHTSGGWGTRRTEPRGSSDELPSRSRGTNVTVTRASALSGLYHHNLLPPTRQTAAMGLEPKLLASRLLLLYYFTSTVAPASVNFFLMASASSLFTPSLMVLGAPSTKSLASFKPRLVTSRTALMTLILFEPAAVSTTVNSVFSSAGAAAAAPPPAAGAAATAAAAADTPSFSSSNFTSWDASSSVSP